MRAFGITIQIKQKYPVVTARALNQCDGGAFMRTDPGAIDC